MFKWQDSASKVSEAEDVQVFQTYNNNDEFYTKESINTLLEAMMKMSFVKIIFDKFSPRGVNDIFKFALYGKFLWPTTHVLPTTTTMTFRP